METNDYLDKYMNLQAVSRSVDWRLGDLDYRNKAYPVSVRPSHLNSFFLELKVRNSEVSLPVRDARELAQFILDSTQGLGDTDGIRDEITKRRKI